MRGNPKYIRKVIIQNILNDFKIQVHNKPRKFKKKLTNEFQKRILDLRRYQLTYITQALGRANRNGQTKPLMAVTVGLGKSLSVKNCEHCGKALTPAPAKLRADGEQTYCGFIPCACNRPIMTDMGVIDPGTEEHDILLKTGNYSSNDLLTPKK